MYIRVREGKDLLLLLRRDVPEVIVETAEVEVSYGGGRCVKKVSDDIIEVAVKRVADGVSVSRVCRDLGISRVTWYKRVEV
jgi:transcriptional regulator of acetoin/glycerol metabolism